MPSAVSPGPDQLDSDARASWSARTRSSDVSGSGSTSIVPAVASTSTRVPPAMVSAPPVPTTHGIASWRAMIAVWLVGPPRSVTSASTTDGSRPAVSAGREVLGHQDRGLARRGDARLGLADDVGDQPLLDVAEVGHPLGHQPAHAGEDGGELLDRAVHGREQVVARAQLLADRAAQPLVAGEAGARGQDLGGGAGGLLGLAGEAFRHGADGIVVRRQGGLGIGEVTRAEAGDRVGRHLAAGDEGGTVGDTRNDRGAAQQRLGRGLGTGDHGHKLPRHPP